MSYEIPSELRYEEKVIFGLSIPQSLWLGAAAIASLAIFLKTPFPIEEKTIAALPLLGLGAGFAFFGLGEHTRSALGFLSKPREAGYFDARMKEFVGVQKIEHDTVFMKDGSARALIAVQPINFHILSEAHKQAVIMAYRDFLNSLDFSIQIAMRTSDLSMDGYFERLELMARKAKNTKTYEQFVSFRDFTQDYIRSKGSKNRVFYIVIPADKQSEYDGNRKRPDQSGTIESLEVRAKVCQQKLQNCNLFTRRLTNPELVSLFAGYFDCAADAKEDFCAQLTSLKAGSLDSGKNQRC